MRYIQIAGIMKSGTSLTSALFDHHPDIVNVPGQSSNTGADFLALSNPDVSLENKIPILESKIKQIVKPKEEALARFNTLVSELHNDFAALHYCLLQVHCETMCPEKWGRARVWLDKSPFSHVYADEIFNIYSSAKFIHVIRDPRDNFSSAAARLFRNKESFIEMQGLLWRYFIWHRNSLTWAMRNQRKYGESRYHILRYEDLVTEPTSTMACLADFAGIEMCDILCDPTRNGKPYAGNNKEGVLFSGVDPFNVGRWRERIPKFYAMVMENQPAEHLQHFGYRQEFSAVPRTTAGAINRALVIMMPDSMRRRHSRTANRIYDQRLFDPVAV